jgi:hypothetical protein
MEYLARLLSSPRREVQFVFAFQQYSHKVQEETSEEQQSGHHYSSKRHFYYHSAAVTVAFNQVW